MKEPLWLTLAALMALSALGLVSGEVYNVADASAYSIARPTPTPPGLWVVCRTPKDCKIYKCDKAGNCKVIPSPSPFPTDGP